MSDLHSRQLAAFDVTLVTYSDFPNLAPDDVLLLQALRAMGLKVRVSIWDDPDVDWADSTVSVMRSTWDCFHKISAFSDWLSRVEGKTRLVNNGGVIRWNMEKTYLVELESAGISIVPTVFFPAKTVSTADVSLPADWDDVVIKPTVSGSAFGAKRLSLQSDRPSADAHLRVLLARGGAMVQPYLREVETSAERALAFIGGQYSHAVRKAPFNPGAAGGGSAERAHVASGEEIAFAKRVLKACNHDVAYARVDIVPTESGPLLMELELIEPALFFRHRAGSAEALANEIADKVILGRLTP